MQLDDRRLNEMIEESQDLQSDAMSAFDASLPELRDVAADRRREPPEPSVPSVLADTRRGVLRRLGLGGGAVMAGGFGAALAALVAPRPAGADTTLDVQMLQTASSLESLAVATYQAALGLDFIKNGNKVVVKFAETTMSQHDAHKKAFQAQTTALGGKVQDQPNPVYAAIVEKAKPTLKGPLDVVKLAATLEKVATDTYLTDLTLFTDTKSKSIMGSVMGVESQHLAILLAVQALIEGGAPELIAIPTDLAKLPAAAGSVAFPKAFETTTSDSVAPPESGAVK